MIDKFGEFGATQITNIPSNSHPYIFIGKKGESTALHEEIAPDDASILHVEYDLVGRLTVGVIKSPIIGPTNDWSTYSHKFEMQENDSITVAVYGIDQDGLKTATPIKTYENQKEIEIDLKNNDPIDAAIYPSVQFETYLYDTLDNSAPQINRWAITSKQLPEGVINTSAIGIENYHLSTVEVGYPLTFDFVFENISPIDFSDSVKVLVNLQGELRDSVINATLTPLKGGESLTYSLSLPTENLIGTNTLQVFFNPYNQLEAIYENNIVAIPFTVSADQTSPVIDVLFDNRHIKDGEIVSPNPEITIYYHDNNNYNIKQDTNGVFLFLQQPCEEGNCTYDRVYFSEQSVVSWTSQTENSPFTIQYSPTNLSDGVYFLKIHGQDQAGNLSSEEPYVISFEVVNHQSITNLTPFPNPFRTYCQFEFTLTGNEIPQDITIEIHSASGELVRTITYDELGVLHAGHNITDFKWYGTNDSGAQLANGLYIYRVIIENGDTNIEYIDTSDNKYKQGVGKIMIMR